ncbi:hypothetical protein [Capnocytophaga gingivalis]|jgi:hypothetical protein|uniref:hypothetical protein n=1 Tax=Capnocytophaga gingivalis TaxID=1017 RepID=UPI0028E3FF63|nr:hypothetical protein [Capnocytophaga gingivalis]
MKLKDEGLEFTSLSIPYIPIMKPNTSFAAKKVATSYKEYDIVTDENGNVCLGEFNIVPLLPLVGLRAKQNGMPAYLF